MTSSIQFLHEPQYTDSVILFILTPAGMQYASADIGSNLFGSEKWTDEVLLIDGLAPKAGFRYSDIKFHWTDFLDLAYRHVDHALFYIPHKRTFKEISKDSLIHQNPDLYSFSFHKFTCEARQGMVQSPSEEKVVLRIMPSSTATAPRDLSGTTKSSTFASSKGKTTPITKPATRTGREDSRTRLDEARSALIALIEAGWSANAVANHTGITSMTIGSIKNGKSSQISARVYEEIMRMKADYDQQRIIPAARRSTATSPHPVVPSTPVVPPTAGRRSLPDVTTREPKPRKTETAATNEDGLVRTDLITIDSERFAALLDRLASVFAESLDDLKEMRSLLDSKR
jgi:hypothetical protein